MSKKLLTLSMIAGTALTTTALMAAPVYAVDISPCKDIKEWVQSGKIAAGTYMCTADDGSLLTQFFVWQRPFPRH